MGSVIALTDETGTVKTQYTYDPFGNTIVSGEPSDNPFQYTGRENDGANLYYYRARYYSPELQRFISEDPIGFEGGNNLFAYLSNNPINKSDPLGLKGCGPGSGFWEWIVPDKPLGVNFENCCNKHDDCYGCKGKAEGKLKADCDKQFCECLVKKCLFSFPSTLPCPSLEYCLAVTFGGSSAFNDARKCCP